MTTPSTSTTGTIKQAVPEMDCWREQVSAIDGPATMSLFLDDLSDHVSEEPDFYNHDDLAGTLCAMACAFSRELSAKQFREVAVMLLVALSWDGKEIEVE